MSYIIRQAKPEDIEIVFELMKSLAIYEKMEDEFVTNPDTLRKNIFEDQFASVLILEESDVPVGFALYFFNYSTFLGKPGLYLEDLFIDPASRGKGYGKALLAELARIAKEKNCGRMEWAVLNWNDPAIEFYKSLGAKPMDTWTVYRLEHDKIEELSKK
ncbi:MULTISPECIES: GNAT family N-acetyltransferase [Amniculibacterium]|uniref:GNAT family N-acetyltransferase n=1 Tax=Amniculibacterium TaxID=2715289 RepID=UPI000F5AB55B|nr:MULTISPECIES: GNAT family N-acetyltransferase [Amniculibacterium]